MMKSRIRSLLLLGIALRNSHIAAFSSRLSFQRPPQSALYSTDNEASGEIGSGLLVSSEASKTQLFSAFAALSLPDQYDAVLTGLCAKILDGESSIKDDEGGDFLKDPMDLVGEMNGKKIPASPRSLMALVDSAVKAQDAETMATVLSLCVRNPSGVRQYGAQQADLVPLPPTSATRTPSGKTRQERLEGGAYIPYDNREEEIAYAAAFLSLGAVSGGTHVLGMEDMSHLADLLFFSSLAVGAVDNFYDLLKAGTQMAVGAVQAKAAEGSSKDGSSKDTQGDKFEMPAKDSLPMGLGTGELTGTVVKGLARLGTVDTERESKCEAAALYAAYTLGLSCFAFRPNAYESSVLVAESMASPNDSLLTSTGILRMLVWLLAPIAMESASYAQLIMSDPREASSFLDRLEELAQSDESVASELWWLDDAKEREDLLQWAYMEADLLLRSNRKVVNEIAERLTGGAATVGDCVAVVEQW